MRRPILHRNSFTFLVAALLSSGLVLPATGQQLPPGFADAWSAVEGQFLDGVREEGVVGASLGFVAGGELVRLAVHGEADVDQGRAVDEETIYHWASITKTLTGIAVMQLRDRGLLSLDDPAVNYVPELAEVHNPFGSMESITLRHLLSHSAGFRSPTWPWAGGEDWHPHEPTEWSQLVAMMPYTNIEFEPGSRWHYSNPGIVFLGRVIESLSGDDFETYMEKNVLRPLGMASSYYDNTPYHLLRHRSNHYWGTGEDRITGGLDFDTGITVSNGGLNASIPDMARYMNFLLGHATTDAAQGVLSRASLEEMWELHQPIGESDGNRQSMALAFFLFERNGVRYVGHTGHQRSFASFFYMDPETGTGTIAVFNTADLPGDDRVSPDTERVFAETRDGLMDRVFPTFRGN